MKLWQPVLKATSSDVRRLSYVDRFSSIPVLIRENTAEHLTYTALYAILIHNELEGDSELDAPILMHALTHDLSDSIGGDLVRTFKYSSSEFTQAVHKAEEKVLEKISPKLFDLCEYHKNWMERSYIELVVKAADFVSLYQYIWREKNMGNKEIEPFFKRMLIDMKTMQQKILKEKIMGHIGKKLAALYGLMGSGNFYQEFVTT